MRIGASGFDIDDQHSMCIYSIYKFGYTGDHDCAD